MKALQKVLNELNSPKIIDGEKYDSNFKFATRKEDNCLFIYDEYESYHIDYLEEQNCLIYSCAQEFGFKFEPETIDKIHEEIEKAIKKDFGKDAYLEWFDNVTMCIGI